VTIVAPLDDSPAERAGIRAGDRIIAVDGESTEDWNLIEAVQRIRGPRDTPVTLTIERDGIDPFDVEIIRAEIKTSSVSWKMLADDIAHLRISRFSQRTNEELEPVLQEILDAGAKGIIMDLRNNPGGILDVTVEVASQFLEDGVVLFQVDGDGNREVWEVIPDGLATDIPLAVLVNRGSASGSEVLAGAIQDHARAPLIGEKTFGKGSVNHINQLSDGSALYVTFARWYTPKDRLIEGQGLDPDIPIEFAEEHMESGTDPQLDRAIQYINEGK
jgi:carboxyl-terminal processing protease